MKTAVWSARTGAGLHPDLLAYSQSIEEDKPFLVHDLAGSSAHVLGLAKVGLLSKSEATQLLEALRGILREHEAGTFRLHVELEDIHMNVEARLTQELGDVGRRLHTGRSRNDQVATCIVLFARLGLARLSGALHALAQTVAHQAEANVETPWVARTHGMPAQPATTGFLLAAHAHRLQDAVQNVLEAFAAIGESPLGSGAVAGSTLPLRPEYTARLLGLRPPRNALLATGTRDAVVRACQAAQNAGLAMASLSQDLLTLFQDGLLLLPPGYTTGSSLMPQKRNPDALELARGRGKALVGPATAASALLGGLGLGYQRDFQLAKPYLVAALHDAVATAELLGPLLAGMTCRPARQEAWASPGIVATDVAEALVAAGMPFRSAYEAVARAYARVEAGSSFGDALGEQALPPEQLQAAIAAMQPDPARRAAVGGTAPQAVRASLARFAVQGKVLAAQVTAAQDQAEVPLRLLSSPVADLLET